MNKSQRGVLIGAFVLILLTVIFPPWQKITVGTIENSYRISDVNLIPITYTESFIIIPFYDKPEPYGDQSYGKYVDFQIDLLSLSIVWGAILLLTGIAYLALRSTKIALTPES